MLYETFCYREIILCGWQYFLSLCVCDCTVDPQRNVTSGWANRCSVCRRRLLLMQKLPSNEESILLLFNLLWYLEMCHLWCCINFLESALCDVTGWQHLTTSLNLQGVYLILLKLRQCGHSSPLLSNLEAPLKWHLEEGCNHQVKTCCFFFFA